MTIQSKIPHSFFSFLQEPQFFTAIVDNIGDEVVLIDSKGRIVYVNEATVRGLEYRHEELLKKRIYDLFEEKMTFAQWKAIHFDPLKKAKRPVSLTINRKTKSGKHQDIEVTVVYMKYKSEEYILSLARDITVKLGLQKELRESEDRYRLLTESAADGIFTVDLSGRITYANQALVQLSKISLEEAVGRHFKHFLTKTTLAKASACFQMATKGLYRIREELEIIRKDGDFVPVEVNVSPLYRDRKIIGVHAIVRDIRRRKEVENMVRESEKKYRDIFEAATDALILAGPNGIIVGANRQAELLFGRNKMDLIGLHKSQLFPAEHAEECEKIFKKSSHDQNVSCDLEIKRRDGEVLNVSASGRWINVANDEIFLIRLIDLSARVGQEERLREVSKMQAVGLFVSGTAQEVMHPLESIRSLVKKILEKYKNREFEYIGFKEYSEIMSTIENIETRVENCCQITGKLLKVNKKKAGLQKKESDVHKVVKGVTELLSQQMTLSNIGWQFKLSPKLPWAAIEEGELTEVVNHVVTNAIQAMPSGGRLMIKAYLNREGLVAIDFKDDGIGIPKEDMPRIFEPFFTTKQRGLGKNIGLGLSIVYSVIKNCGGDVLIKSSLSQGTLVTILIPAIRKTLKK